MLVLLLFLPDDLGSSLPLLEGDGPLPRPLPLPPISSSAINTSKRTDVYARWDASLALLMYPPKHSLNASGLPTANIDSHREPIILQRA